jgi:hypothetical protein
LSRLAKLAAAVHTALVAAGVYYVVRVANFTPLSALPNTDMTAFSAAAIPPLLAVAIGSWLAKSERAMRILGLGLALGAAVYAASLAGVMTAGGNEPLAPLWLILVSLWLAAGYAILLLVVWLVGRRAA